MMIKIKIVIDNKENVGAIAWKNWTFRLMKQTNEPILDQLWGSEIQVNRIKITLENEDDGSPIISGTIYKENEWWTFDTPVGPYDQGRKLQCKNRNDVFMEVLLESFKRCSYK